MYNVYITAPKIVYDRLIKLDSTLKSIQSNITDENHLNNRIVIVNATIYTCNPP
jgi:hypothetical protein